jgi:drug/metabolite transporter (DMT)-like permease
LTSLAVFFWILNVVLDTTGHLAFKAVATVDHDTEFGRWKKMLSLPVMWLGMACFVLEFVAWLALLSLIPLSLALIIGTINIVAVMLAGKILFGERLDRMRVAGISFITIGVALAGGFA